MYGSETVIPTEVGLTSYKVDNHDEGRNDKAIRLQLDLVDEVRATQNKDSHGTKTAWRSITTPEFNIEISR